MKVPGRKRRAWEAKEKPAHSGRKVDHSHIYNGRRWRKLRAYFLAKNPLCKECKENDRITPATVVDHIKPIREGGGAYDFNNLQALCQHHHAVKSGRERHSAEGHRGSKPEK